MTGESQEQIAEAAEYPFRESTGKIIGAAMEVHRNLGYGFLESVYESALAVELRNQKILFEQQKQIDVYYEDSLVKQFFCDFLVEKSIVVELKTMKQLTHVETGQILNYLKATRMKLGLLLNFGASSLQYKRVIN